ncbi:hypothetical protein BMS3Bbin14_02295 [bacterium BMS3Bbin14]|nr:hypothetical protein BMS3Abin13_02217 [bacterium BMS3Abin13]GBE53793.1 hypothetical protein BMS3Bbin14_02295 [bacterium BMS3Bbin14]
MVTACGPTTDRPGPEGLIVAEMRRPEVRTVMAGNHGSGGARTHLVLQKCLGRRHPA